jgi:hypothetical protein
MCAWKAHDHIDFNFADFQLGEAIVLLPPKPNPFLHGKPFWER